MEKVEFDHESSWICFYTGLVSTNQQSCIKTNFCLHLVTFGWKINWREFYDFFWSLWARWALLTLENGISR